MTVLQGVAEGLLTVVTLLKDDRRRGRAPAPWDPRSESDGLVAQTDQPT